MEWPWQAAERRAAAAAAAAERHALEAEAAWRRALQWALAAGEAADLATGGGVRDGRGAGLDNDLETLDAHREGWRR